MEENDRNDFIELARMMMEGGRANLKDISRWGLEPEHIGHKLDAYHAVLGKNDSTRTDIMKARRDLMLRLAVWSTVLRSVYEGRPGKLQEFGIRPGALGPAKVPDEEAVMEFAYQRLQEAVEP